jgi:DNA mismatch repair protein MSH6
VQVTEAQQQWWGFKSDNFDSVIMFKVGKFYEVRRSDHMNTPAGASA